MKDLPGDLPEGLMIAAVLERADARDALLTAAAAAAIADLPRGARVGTSSLRRQAQLLAARPDLRIETLRGNVDTRLRRLDGGELDAIVLACAGLIRLGLESRITARLDPQDLLPAVAQGVIGIECRGGDARTRGLLTALEDAATRTPSTRSAPSRTGSAAAVNRPSRRMRAWRGRNDARRPGGGARRLAAAARRRVRQAPQPARWARCSPSESWPPARARCSSGCAPPDPMPALQGVGVLVTRPEHQAMPLCRLLEAQGASTCACPRSKSSPSAIGARRRRGSAALRISISSFSPAPTPCGSVPRCSISGAT